MSASRSMSGGIEWGARIWFTQDGRKRPGRFLGVEDNGMWRIALDDAGPGGAGMEHIVYSGNCRLRLKEEVFKKGDRLICTRYGKPTRVEFIQGIDEECSEVLCSNGIRAFVPTSKLAVDPNPPPRDIREVQFAGAGLPPTPAPARIPTPWPKSFTREEIVKRLFMTDPRIIALVVRVAELEPIIPTEAGLERRDRAYERAWALAGGDDVLNGPHGKATIEWHIRREYDVRVRAMFPHESTP